MSGYLTTRKLSNVLDLPVALPATEVKQGDWIIVASVKVVSPMKLTHRFLNLAMLTSSVTVSQISNTNKIVSSLGLAYVVLRRDYSGSNPGSAGSLDTLVINDIGSVSRNTDTVVTLTTAGTYSWIVANNMQPSSSSTVPTSTEINFRLQVNGSVRLDLDQNA